MEHLKPLEADEFLKREPTAVFVDCRSEMEFLFVGHPVSAMTIPWNDGPDWDINPHFVGQVKKAVGHSTHRPVVLICRSGNRSIDAGNALEAAGFTRVYNVLEGFEGDLDENHHRGKLGGWRCAGLPWAQM
jgi:rhodanese-related sulfurtransferase